MRPKIYLFGDSITEMSFDDGGWGAALTNHFSRKVDVVVRGYSGYNTRWALKVIERIFPVEAADGGDKKPPLAVTVFFGANDAVLPDRSCAFQHVHVDEYKSNLCSIISFFKRAIGTSLMWSSASKDWGKRSFAATCAKERWPTTHVLLITPPPIDEAGRLLFPYVEDALGLSERTNEHTSIYAKACLEVASQCQIPAIDLWTKMQQFPNWQKDFLSDGLHLTKDGNKIVFEEVIEKFKEKGVSLETLPFDLPHFTEIDPKDPLRVFNNLK